MSVNKAILIGRLGKDPELRYTPGGSAVATFSLATSEVYKNQEGQRQENTTWHNIVCWGKTAELAKEYLRKGSEVYFEGRISNRSYDDKEGNKRYISEVVVQTMKFLGSRQQGDAGTRTTEDVEAAPSQANAGDDDLPF